MCLWDLIRLPQALKLCWDLLCVDSLFSTHFFCLFLIIKIIDESSRRQSYERVEHRRIHLQNLPVHLGMQLFLLPIQTTGPFQIMTGLSVFNLSCEELGGVSLHPSSSSPGSACPSWQGSEHSLAGKSSWSWQPARNHLLLPEHSLRRER